MSHISKVNTKIKDLLYLKKALQSLGMTCIEAEGQNTITVSGYEKNEIIEDCVMEIKVGAKYGIGVRKKGTDLEIVADWWAIETFTGQKQEDLINKITRQYAYETIMDKIKDLGYGLVQEEQDSKQNVRLTVRRWG